MCEHSGKEIKYVNTARGQNFGCIDVFCMKCISMSMGNFIMPWYTFEKYCDENMLICLVLHSFDFRYLILFDVFLYILHCLKMFFKEMKICYFIFYTNMKS